MYLFPLLNPTSTERKPLAKIFSIVLRIGWHRCRERPTGKAVNLLKYCQTLNGLIIVYVKVKISAR